MTRGLRIELDEAAARHAEAVRQSGQPGPIAEPAERVVADRTGLLGPTHPDTLVPRVGLALAADGDIDAAVAAFRLADGADGPSSTSVGGSSSRHAGATRRVACHRGRRSPVTG